MGQRTTEYWEDWLKRNAASYRSQVGNVRDWYRIAGVSKGERRLFRAALRNVGEGYGRKKGKFPRRSPERGAEERGISHEGRLRAVKGDADGRAPEGRLKFTREGRPVVVLDTPENQSVRIPGNALSGAWPRDRVRVRLERRRGGAPLYGKIVQVVRRGIRAFVGRYAPIGDRKLVRLRDREADLLVPAEVSPSLSPEPGELVLAEITEYPAGGREGRSRIVRVLGMDHTMETIDLAVTCARDIPVEFSPDAMRETEEIPRTVRIPAGGGRTDTEGLRRIDHRHLPFVTIDGDDARDFDDAVCLVPDRGGERLYVAIADVSHYVAQGSAIDRDAYARGTSVYFPDRAVPMLPPALSEGVCSLKPGVNRLTLTTEIPIDPEGRAGPPAFYPSAIRSRARLTYGEVHSWLTGEGESLGAAERRIPPEIGKMLRRMETVSRRLSRARSGRGALDFDLPEARISVVDGMPRRIEAAPRWESHRLIEEFMLLANAAVAEFLAERSFPFLFRIHEEPPVDRVEEFEETASRMLRRSRVAGSRALPSRLQAWAEAARGGKFERYLNLALLRSLMLARYGPEEIGHFGLALSRYTHFTSPIRRYPDLIVHRVLKAALGDPRHAPYARMIAEKGEAAGAHLSGRERAATEAERDVESRAKALYLSDRVGERFEGVISSVLGYGFFVEFIGHIAEGFVHISTLRDDVYRYTADRGEWYGLSRKTRLGLGDRVLVRLRRADVDRGELDLVFVEKLPDSP
jgi:ribonuclease R